MKIERTKNAVRNITFEGLYQVMNILIPFIMRTVILHTLGVEYLGINGLFRSIFSVLNLAELGVGSAMVFSMYKPIAEDDHDTICALMRLYRTLYRIIGLVVLTIGLALTPFLPVLIKGEITADVNLYVLYFMFLGSTAMSYWLFAYKNCLLTAHQRNDVGSKIALAVHFTEYTLKIIVLVVFKNYYLFISLQIVAQILKNIFTAIRANQIYPHYTPKGILSAEKRKNIALRVRDLFTSNVSAVISDSADTIVISAFLGIVLLAIYQNYFFIVSSLRMMVNVIIGACLAGIGNSLITESVEKNYRDMEKMTVLFGWLMTVCTSMLLCMYQPFMQIWMGEDSLLAFPYVICFTIYFHFIGMNRLLNMYKDAAGIWKIDKWRPLAATIVNLTLNLATVKWLGLYGVLLSTVVSIVLVQIPWLFRNLFKHVFPEKHLWQYVRLYFSFTALSIAACAASVYLCSLLNFNIWLTFFANTAISFIVPNVLFFVFYGRLELFKAGIQQIKRTLRK